MACDSVGNRTYATPSAFVRSYWPFAKLLSQRNWNRLPPSIGKRNWQYKMTNLHQVSSKVVISVKLSPSLSNHKTGMPLQGARKRQNIPFVIIGPLSVQPVIELV